MTLIIAEAGVNHNGDERMAFELADAAHAAGADIVKFQTFTAKNLVTSTAPQANYQALSTGKKESQLSMLSRLELSYDAHRQLASYCEKLGIEFLSTAFDFEGLRFLAHDLGLKRLKVASGEITNAPFVLEHARSGCDLVVSSGMATLSEIEAVLGVIAFGFLASPSAQPGKEAFVEAYSSDEGQQILRKKVTLLHCTTEYPAPMSEINLRAMSTLASAFMLPTGYSDHSEGISIPIAAVARGAVMLEKHFTLDKTMEGPDHRASIEPNELKEMVEAVRKVGIALGDGVKRPTASEVDNKLAARKSIVAACTIAKGEIFTIDNLTIKRPGNGISPFNYWDMLGKVSVKGYAAGDLLSE